MKIKQVYIAYSYFAILVIFIILLFTGLFTAISGRSMVVIENSDPNSMAPTYFQGDLFIINKVDPEKIVIGDVIVFEGINATVIHRVIGIEIRDGSYYFRTKGDNPNNVLPDVASDGSGFLIPYDAILGKVTSRIPYLGHISLALKRDPTTKIITFLFVGIFLIALIFWPNDDEEENEKIYDFTRDTIQKYLHTKLSSIRLTIGKVKIKENRIFTLFFVSIIVLMLIFPFFHPSFIPGSTGDYGIDSLNISQDRRITNNALREINYFIQVSVEFHDYTSIWYKIERVEIKAYQGNDTTIEPISDTIWTSLRYMKGRFMYGGSVFLHGTDLSEPSVDLKIVVNLIMSPLIGRDKTMTSNLYYTLNVTL